MTSRGRIHVWTLCFTLLICLYSADPSPAADVMDEETWQDGPALFNKTREWILALPSLEVPFTQINRWTGWGDEAPDTARGVLYLERPCCFRLEYDEPAGHAIVCDGESLWTYVPELEQVIRTPVPEEGIGAGDLFLWLLRSAHPDSFAVLVDPPVYRLGVEPPAEIGWRELEILIDINDGSIAGYYYEDLQENRTAFQFAVFKTVPRGGREAFRFISPPGVEVVDVE
ncbi:MAG: outer membrane lipoprotein carrier protein LolA [Candidatus Eisenbacteria bacterium]|uniref:Outer membrane lipoprotein carrier protein LolA n=1 Tax=Eiseniibacteriota bacterium TaxID=2212470 RepID=A0A948RRV6_UNCEI|nr:outer membrane lipoprotein carrier protein LolA [Candidatus Eisenbacteria bacterium]MBU1950130.1 outer membrane lipoprotein carrier protein LolA [Candidatus Eisenbacteria bacterium]MBU2689840.1 outer membrane lipoprotein carrier protein LolA [Candidatus Eisenbacteria bacterium]